MEDANAPAPARQLAEKLFAQKPLSDDRLNTLEQFLNPLQPEEVEKQQIVQKADALNLQTAGGALDMSDQGFDIKKGTQGMEFLRNLGENVQSFLGVNKATDEYFDEDANYNQARYNVDSPLNIDKYAAAAGEKISDVAGGITNFLVDKNPFKLSKEAQSE